MINYKKIMVTTIFIVLTMKKQDFWGGSFNYNSLSCLIIIIIVVTIKENTIDHSNYNKKLE